MTSPLTFFKKHISSNRVGKYEAEVRFGLLVIVLSLLMLNFISNTLLYRASESRRGQINREMVAATLGITRSFPQGISDELPDQKLLSLKTEYHLSKIDLIRSIPFDETIESKRAWFNTVVDGMSPTEATELGRTLFSADYKNITKGDGATYSYVVPITIASRDYLLIMSQEYPDLAYLDSAQEALFYIGFVGMLCVGLVYILLSRFILAPFRKLRKQALLAGRLGGDVSDDAEELVDEYRRMIADLKQSQEQLVELNEEIRMRADSLEEFNRQLLSSMSSGLISLNTKGDVQSINSAGEGILRVSASNVIGQGYAELFRGADSVVESIRNCIETGVDVDYFEAEIRTMNTSTMWLGLSISTVRNAKKEMIGLSVFVNDLSELIQLRQELEKQQRMAALGEMSGGLAHQLRNSLGAISGYIKLIHKRMQKRDIEDKSMPALLQEVNEADDLVGRFLQFARPLQLEVTACDLQELVNEVIESIAVRSEFKNISFHVQGVYDGLLNLDPLLLKQALTNLFENSALAYNGVEGEVGVILTANQSEVCFNIQDHGCGIPESDLQRIFTPFFSSRPSGSGLGLPLADKIIQLHGGHLTVESTMGKGTCFTIKLPLTEPSMSKNKKERNSSTIAV